MKTREQNQLCWSSIYATFRGEYCSAGQTERGERRVVANSIDLVFILYVYVCEVREHIYVHGML